ncbi:phosphoribosylglycinamide formyltransferase [Flavobacterium caeni]|uniref:Phosphoribosylglycinamide formyltransferase n=1 Tax=Flavobacterium caeni TaxID=490189 RepID=A0A1G5H271_9FLAO|nr:phosphoribosylglycinamide formyltransferase [Flavobacterium caeni]SCY57639.1 formyltetrahydrofolate-dependent phosphoribosylglycinamide formyltransferase [Flavobacterium caeni]
MKKIVLFASGSGSNAENIIRFFAQRAHGEVVAVFCNNPHAKVIDRAENLGVPVVVFDKEALHGESVLLKLRAFGPDLIVLAGFLWMFPAHIIAAFPNQIINIHPALLPKYGGKGMYGMHVHRAIREANETETGISIHYVDPHYDEGDLIFQAKVPVEAHDTPEQIAQKVQQLEYDHFPKVIEQLLLGVNKK